MERVSSPAHSFTSSISAEPCVCYPLHTSDEPIESLARVSSKLRGHECHNGASAGTDEDQALMSTDQSNGDRVWTYQTCTEFGFFQTCEVGSRCPYAQGYLPLSKYLTRCEAAFGLSPEQVSQAVQLSNEYYGADRYVQLKLSRFRGVCQTYALYIHAGTTQATRSKDFVRQWSDRSVVGLVGQSVTGSNDGTYIVGPWGLASCVDTSKQRRRPAHGKVDDMIAFAQAARLGMCVLRNTFCAQVVAARKEIWSQVVGWLEEN